MKEILIKKLDEDDILEIVSEYIQETEFKNCINWRCKILGSPGDNLRFIAVYGDDDNEAEVLNSDLDAIDTKTDFNGNHAFLKRNPDFYINKDSFKGLKKYPDGK